MKRDTDRVFTSVQPSGWTSSSERISLGPDALAFIHPRRLPGVRFVSTPELMPGSVDLVICEQVLEHVVDPLTAVRTLARLRKRDGFVFVSTPFLIRLHDFPGDYWRFTPAGLGLLLRSQGLAPMGEKLGKPRLYRREFRPLARDTSI